MFDNQSSLEVQELLLHSARNGDLPQLQSLLQARTEGLIELDISCKGTLKYRQLHYDDCFLIELKLNRRIKKSMSVRVLQNKSG